jgi:adenylate cyclase
LEPTARIEPEGFARVAALLAQTRLTRRDLRLGSGLVMFTYIAGHLINHSIGLISVAAAERGLGIAIAIWHSLPGTVLLYGSAAIHVSLAFLSLYERRTLRMPPLELVRIALGFGIPTLLIAHTIGTRIQFEAYGYQTGYSPIVWSLWHSGREGRQMALLVPGWLHGCLGLNFAFGRRAWYRRYHLALFAAALVLPILAVLGFLSMLKEVSLMSVDPAWAVINIPNIDAGQKLRLSQLQVISVTAYGVAIGAVLVARALRRIVEERRGALISIAYPNRTIRVPRGWTVLEASRSHHIPHQSACGGRARCSTCRVRVVTGAEQCPEPQPDERRTLDRIHAPEGTRLACQLRPQDDVTVIPLLAAGPPARREQAQGPIERQVAVMLVDLRWTATASHLLPQDLLYLFNRFAEAIGETVRSHGGVPNQFSGERVMALFGLEVESIEANRQALAAAAEIDQRLSGLMSQLGDELGCAIGYAIHLHTGMAGVGETGDVATRTLTAVGSSIDDARQIAAASADDPLSRIVVTKAVVDAAHLDPESFVWRDVVLPGGARVAVSSSGAVSVA